MSESAVLTVPEAAALLGIGERTAYELARRDEFPVPVLKIGRSRKVSRRALEQFIDGSAPAPAPRETGEEQ